MWKTLIVVLALVAIVFGLFGTTKTTVVSRPPATNESRQVYKTRGFVKELFLPHAAKIAHEEITNYMAAMVMKLEVKNTNELTGIKVGDQITFDMVVTADDGWIENIKKTGIIDASAATNLAPNFRRVREVDPLEVGQPMPDYPFITEDGKPLRLSDLKGSAIAFSFIFTRCPFPTMCPRMNTHFEKAATELAKPGNPTNWHFLSISFDTEYDKPAELKKYAARYTRNPAKWNFVTGEQIEIDAITEQFGLAFAKRNGTIDHNLRTVIVDANNKIQQIYIGNEWSLDEFIAEMKKAAAAKPESK